MENKGGYVLADNPNFIEDLAKKYTMTVYPDQEGAFQVDLNEAMRGVLDRVQEELEVERVRVFSFLGADLEPIPG